NAIDQWPNSAKHSLFFIETVYRNHGRRFGEAVTLHDHDACGGKYPDQSYLACRPAGDHGVELVPQSLPPFAENKLVREPELEPVSKSKFFVDLKFFCKPMRPEKHPALQSPKFIPLLHNAVVQLFEESRHGGKHVRSYFLQIVADCFQTFRIVNGYSFE